MRNTMTTISKVALALAGVAGLALAAETAHAFDINGTGSSSGRQFAGLIPAAICNALPTPLLFVSSESRPNKYEWQCNVTVSGTTYPNSRIRYSATNSSDAFEKQPPALNGTPVVGTAVYLNTAGCPAGVNVTILGKTVTRSVCPASTPPLPVNQSKVHWGGSDVQSSSLKQTAGGVVQLPPPSDHLTVEPVAVIPFSIVVGSNVRKMVTPDMPLTSLSLPELRQMFDPPALPSVVYWTDFGYDTTDVDKVMTVCQRQGGSGALATLDQTVMLNPFLGVPVYRGVSNQSSSNMIACINSHPNSIGYVDSDSVIPAAFPSGAYQVQIDGQPVNAGALTTGVARLTALRCGRYPYWADWNFVTRRNPNPPNPPTPELLNIDGAPYNGGAGATTALTALGVAMLANNPLPDFWVGLDDMFVFKNQDRGPHNWQATSNNGELIANVCD